jgi:DNA-binding MarR family transcriptional regulator
LSAEGKTLKDLLSYRLQSVSNLMARSAQLRYRAEFDVSIGEWRALALLATTSPMALNELAKAAGLDKGQMSRVAKALVDRKLVLRADSAKGRKLIDLSLSPSGKQTYERVLAAALERDEAFNACLSDQERTVLEGALNKLKSLSLALVRAHQAGVSAD